MMWWFIVPVLGMAICLVLVLALFMINEGDDTWDQQ